MHLLEWIGYALIALCALFAGALCADYEKKRNRQAQGFLALVRHFRAQIEHYATPVAQILATLDEQLLLDCGLCERPLSLDILLGGCELCIPLALTEELEGFFGELGSNYREEQLRCCDYYLGRIAPLCAEIGREMPKRVRLAWLLPPSLAAALALTLI